MGCNQSNQVVNEANITETSTTPGEGGSAPQASPKKKIASPPQATPKKALSSTFDIEAIQAKYVKNTTEVFSSVTEADWNTLREIKNPPPADVKALMEILLIIAPCPSNKLGWGAVTHWLMNPVPVPERLTNLVLDDIDQKLIKEVKKLAKSATGNDTFKAFVDGNSEYKACTSLFKWLGVWQKQLKKVKEAKKTQA